MQPVFVWMCFTVNILFILIKGPKFLKVKPVELAMLIAAGAGIACIPVFYSIQILMARLWPEGKEAKEAAYSSKAMAKLEKLAGLQSNVEAEQAMAKTFDFRAPVKTSTQQVVNE